MTETLQQKQRNLQQQLNGASAFIALGVLFVVLHISAALLRKHQRTTLGWDHAFTSASLCVFIPFCALSIRIFSTLSGS